MTNHNKDKTLQKKLHEMKSVRTTFRLTRDVEEVLAVLGLIDVTMKELIDTLVQNYLTDSEVLGEIATNASNFDKKQEKGNRKTWVISSSALSAITSAAETTNVSRDALFEALILYSLQLIANQFSQRPENLKKARDLVQDFQSHAEAVYGELVDLLPLDEGITRSFYDAVSIADISGQRIKEEIEKLESIKQAHKV